MATSTFALLAYSLKRYYSSRMIEDVSTRATEFWRRLRKAPGMGGEDGAFRWPLLSGNAPGVGGSFVEAQTNAQASSGDQFVAAPKDYYGVMTLDRKLFNGTKVPSMAWMEARKQESESTLRSFGQMMAIHLYRTGTGSIGRRASISSNTITLTVPDEAKHFYRGMRIHASSTDSAAGLRTGSARVTGVNLAAGTVTVDNAAAITAFADNDFLANAGDFTSGVPMGVAGWIPPVAETSGTFFGVARAGSPELLQGFRFTSATTPSATGVSISECIRFLATQIFFQRGNPRLAFVHPRQWNNLATEGGSHVMRGQGGSAEFGFDRLIVRANSGPIEVIADPYCPLQYGWVVDPDSWEYRFIGDDGTPPIQLVTEDVGSGFLRVSNADAFEYRWATYGQLICYAPAWNGVFEMATS